MSKVKTKVGKLADKPNAVPIEVEVEVDVNDKTGEILESDQHAPLFKGKKLLEPEATLTTTENEVMEMYTVPLTGEQEVVQPFIQEKFIIPTPAEVAKKQSDDSKLTFEEKVKQFLAPRAHRGYVRMNEFLKSLYPLGDPTEKPMWTKQDIMKTLKVALEKMCQNKEIEIYSDVHRRLATHYYDPLDVNQVTRYHDLTTLSIDGKSL